MQTNLICLSLLNEFLGDCPLGKDPAQPGRASLLRVLMVCYASSPHSGAVVITFLLSVIVGTLGIAIVCSLVLLNALILLSLRLQTFGRAVHVVRCLMAGG